MACNSYTFKGIAVQCKDSIGGIKHVWIAQREDVRSGFSVDSSTKMAKLTTTDAAKFKRFYLRKNTSSLTSTLNVSENSGNTFSNELSLQFLKMETAKRLEIMGLTMAETMVVVKDGNDKYFVLGWDYPVEASAASGESGTNTTDFNGYKVTLKDDSVELPYELGDAEAKAALEAIEIA